MGLFSPRRRLPVPPPGPGAESPGALPAMVIDVTKWYDVHCHVGGEERVYEEVRFVAVRTFHRPGDFSAVIIGSYLEIESSDGTRALIPGYVVHLICECGAPPIYRVVRPSSNSAG